MTKRLGRVYAEKVRPHGKKIAIGILLFFLVFTVTGFFVLPPLAKSILAGQLSKSLNRQVTINQMRINPYALSVTVRGLTIKDRSAAETFVACDEIFLNLQTLSALRMALVFKEIRLIKPYVKITRNKDLSYNFSDLTGREEPAGAGKEKAKPFRFSLNNITIDGGSIDFTDQPTQTKHTVRDLRLAVPFLSSIPSHVHIFVQPYFSALINDTPYSIQGKTKPFSDSLETFVDIDIKDLDIPHYLAYVPMKMAFKIGSAFLDARLKLSFIQAKENEPSLAVEGNVALKKIAVDDERGKPFFRLPLLDVSIASSQPLSKKIHLSKVSIQSPEFSITRDEKGSLNALSLLPSENNKNKPAPKKAEDTPPLALDIDEIDLTGGKISFSDLSTAKPFRTVLHPVDLKVGAFSNGKDRKSTYALSVTSEAKEVIKAEGQFSLHSLESEGTLSIASVPLKKYSPFYGEKVLFAVDDGRFDFSTRYRYTKGKEEPEITLSAITAAITALHLKRSGEVREFLRVPDFSIRETELNLNKKEVTIGNVSSSKGEIAIRRTDQGLDIAALLPPQPAPEKGPHEPAGRKVSSQPTEKQGRPWVVSLKQALLDGYAVRFTDLAAPEPVTVRVRNLKLKAENISTSPKSKGKVNLSLLLNGKGTVAVAGTVGMEPLSADLKTGVKGVEVAPFLPYLSDKIRLTVTGGSVSTAGRLTLTSGKNGINAGYKGDASLANFASIDKVNGNDVLKLESLSLGDIDFALSPFSLTVKGISLTNFYALVLVRQNGKINLQDIFVKEEVKEGPEAASSPQPVTVTAAEDKGAPKNIRIDQVTLQGGDIDFVDRAVKPEFSARLSEMAGRISGLSADENLRADVELLTKLNDYTPLEITGKINPLSRDLFVDLKARIKDFDLSPATPYSGKYAGYAIEKGKLSLDLEYLIDKGKLDSKNNVFIDQFTFGEKVDSPTATKLPVKLAVALLKDRNGQIKLDLPVTGRLDDPQFSVWRIVVKILTNLVAKAATSPFALLGAVFGGEGDLSYVTFDYGSATLSEADKKKLAAVINALSNRPSLKMDIVGYVDTEKDRDGLKQLLFKRKIKVQKLNQLVKKGRTVPPVDDITFDPGEYEKYLKMAYKQEKFPKPKNIIGLAKDIPVAEMEKLMLTHTVVEEGNLRKLAAERAMEVRDIILKSGQVGTDRIFIVEPKSMAPEKKEKIKDSRVDFVLK